MKRVLCCILAAMLALSVALFTACADEGQAATSDNFSASASSSSARQRGSDADTSRVSVTTSVSESSVSSAAQSTTNSSNEQPAPSYSDYDYTFENQPVRVEFDINETDPVKILDSYIYIFSTDYAKPVLTNEYYSSLAAYESSYKALSATQQGQLKNRAFLLESRWAFDNMASAEAAKLIQDLPDPTLDNITEFGAQYTRIEVLVVKISDTSKIVNFSAYQAKVSASSVLLTDAFAEAVAAIATFEYSAAYKQKLDYASSLYSLMNDAQKNQSSANYSTLTGMQAKYASASVAYSFADTVNALPALDALTDTDQAVIKQLKAAYHKMSAAEQAEIPADVKTKYDNYVSKAAELWPEYYINFMVDGPSGNEYFKVYKSDGGTGDLGKTDDGPKCPGYYDGDTFTKACKFKTDRYVIIQTDAPCVLTIVANIKSGSGNLVVKQGTLSFNSSGKASFSAGSFNETKTVNTATNENTNYTFKLPSAGLFQISSSNSDVLVFYMIYQ